MQSNETLHKSKNQDQQHLNQSVSAFRYVNLNLKGLRTLGVYYLINQLI